MADEYIRKADALNASKITYIECLYEDEGGYIEGESDEIPVVFKRDIEAIPAADVRPVVRGKWIQDCEYHFRCSVCGDRWTVSNGNPLDVSNGWNACPNCGADMRGEDDG